MRKEKKRLALFLTVCTLLALCACGGSAPAASAPPAETAAPEETPAPTPAPTAAPSPEPTATTEPAEEKPLHIYASAPEEWGNLSIQSWNGDVSPSDAGPGESMEKIHDRWYRVDIPSWDSHFVISGQNSEQKSEEFPVLEEFGRDIYVVIGEDGQNRMYDESPDESLYADVVEGQWSWERDFRAEIFSWLNRSPEVEPVEISQYLTEPFMVDCIMDVGSDQLAVYCDRDSGEAAFALHHNEIMQYLNDWFLDGVKRQLISVGNTSLETQEDVEKYLGMTVEEYFRQFNGFSFEDYVEIIKNEVLNGFGYVTSYRRDGDKLILSGGQEYSYLRGSNSLVLMDLRMESMSMIELTLIE